MSFDKEIEFWKTSLNVPVTSYLRYLEELESYHLCLYFTYKGFHCKLVQYCDGDRDNPVLLDEYVLSFLNQSFWDDQLVEPFTKEEVGKYLLHLKEKE